MAAGFVKGLFLSEEEKRERDLRNIEEYRVSLMGVDLARRLSALSALQKFAEKNTVSATLLTTAPGLIADLVYSMRDENAEISTKSASILFHLTAEKILVTIEPGPMADLVHLMRDASFEIKQYSTTILHFLASDNPINQAQIGKIPQVFDNIISRLLVEEAPDYHLKFLWIELERNKENLDLIAKTPNAIENLVRFLRPDYEWIASEILAKLASNSSYLTRIGRSPGLIENIAHILKIKEGGDQFFTLLLSLSAYTEYAVQIGHAPEAIKNLVRMLKKEKGDNYWYWQRIILNILINLAAIPELQVLIERTPNAIENICDILKDEAFQDNVKKALDLLQKLTLTNSDNRTLVAKTPKAIKQIVFILKTTYGEECNNCMRILRNLALNLENQALIIKAGAIAPLLKYSDDIDSTAEIAKDALKCLGYYDRELQEIRKQVLLLKGAHRESAAHILENIAKKSTEHRLLVGRAEGVLENLILLLKDHDTDVIKEAANALRTLAAGNLRVNPEINILIGRTEGAIVNLLALLEHDALAVQTEAVSTLANLAVTSENQLLIGRTKGAIKSLLALLFKLRNHFENIEIQCKAMHIVRLLIEYPENQLLLGKMHKEISQLQDYSPDGVRKDAEEILAIFSKNPIIAEQIERDKRFSDEYFASCAAARASYRPALTVSAFATDRDKSDREAEAIAAAREAEAREAADREATRIELEARKADVSNAWDRDIDRVKADYHNRFGYDISDDGRRALEEEIKNLERRKSAEIRGIDGDSSVCNVM